MISPNSTELVFNDEINVRETLKKLHESFPNLNLDELFKILDCIVLTTRAENNQTKIDNEYINNWTSAGISIADPNREFPKFPEIK